MVPSVLNIYANPPFSNFQLRDWNGLTRQPPRPLIINLEIKTKPDAGAVPVSGSLRIPHPGETRDLRVHRDSGTDSQGKGSQGGDLNSN